MTDDRTNEQAVFGFDPIIRHTVSGARIRPANFERKSAFSFKFRRAIAPGITPPEAVTRVVENQGRGVGKNRRGSA